jgi:adenine-specific DNA methylase
MARWAIRDRRDRVLEPSCGEAAFLVSAARTLRELGARRVDGRRLTGIDIDAESVQRAERILRAEDGAGAEFSVQDFYQLAPAADYDAVIGNPPYIRYQSFSGTNRARALEAALAQGVSLSGLASSWAAFVVHAAAFLRPSGRLALVLPEELLSVNYAEPVRRFLKDRFGSVRILSFAERIFPEVEQNVVVLLAEGEGPAEGIQFVRANALDDVDQARRRRWDPPTEGGKWVLGTLDDEVSELLDRLRDQGLIVPLSQWGRIELGAVTGSNDFFALSADESKAQKLGERDLMPLLPTRSIFGLEPSFTQTRWQELRDEGAKCYLFQPTTPLSRAARQYIAGGEARGVHEAYKCRKRSHWWYVPGVRQPNLFLSYMSHVSPRVVANRANVAHLNTVHGVHLAAGRRMLGARQLPLAVLSTLTRLSAELVGRTYGGGVLKLEPSEAKELLVPSPESLEAADDTLRDARQAFMQESKRRAWERASELVDEILLDDVYDLHVNSKHLLQRALTLMQNRRGVKRKGE